MKKFFVILVSVSFLGTGANAQQSQQQLIQQHVAAQYPYHSPSVVLEKSDTVTLKRVDKTPYKMYVIGQDGKPVWIPVTLRVGEQYLSFKGEYYYNVSQNILLTKVPEQPKKKKERDPNKPTFGEQVVNVLGQVANRTSQPGLYYQPSNNGSEYSFAH